MSVFISVDAQAIAFKKKSKVQTKVYSDLGWMSSTIPRDLLSTLGHLTPSQEADLYGQHPPALWPSISIKFGQWGSVAAQKRSKESPFKVCVPWLPPCGTFSSWLSPSPEDHRFS